MAEQIKFDGDGVIRKTKTKLSKRQVDTRTFGEKVQDSLSNSSRVAQMVILGFFVFGIGFDLSFKYMDLALLFMAIFQIVINNLGSTRSLLFRVPMSSGTMVPDFKNNKANYFAPNGEKVDGLLYFGIDIEDIFYGEELWLSDDDVRKHMLLFGTTGAGKTEALLSLCYGALLTCSGFIFSDGKGTFELYYKVHNTCRKLGQEDDLLLMSFLTGNEDMRNATSQKISNTLNPVAKATQDAASQLLVSLMASNSGGSGDMWAERAAVLMESVMGLLTYRRDVQKRSISVESIRDALVLANYFQVWKDALEAGDNINDERYLPNYVTKAMNGYLVSLPGFSADKPFEEMPNTVSEQHGYLFMQFSKLLGSLADMYGYIFNTQLSEIDFWDVVTNRRILVVLLPALAKSKQELSMLGKIVIACIKQMMTSGLGKYSEGFAGEMAKANPTKSPTPFITILDEFGYYAVAGSAVMPAQARSLGFFMVFAGQDFAAFSASGKEEADAIVANCKLQVCMALQDHSDTFTIFQKKAEQATVYVNSGKIYRDSTLHNQETVTTETRDVITFNDLSRQKSGFAHFFLEGDMARGRFFYAAIPLGDHHEITVNQFVKVVAPEADEIAARNQELNNLYKTIANIQYHETVKDNFIETATGAKFQQLSDMLIHYRELNNQSNLIATCAVMADILERENRNYEESQARAASITGNFQNNQTAIIASNDAYNNAMKNWQQKMENNPNNKTAKPFGIPESVMRENIEDINGVIQDNYDLVQRGTLNSMKELNQSTSYPERKPAAQSPVSIQDLISNLVNEAQKNKEKYEKVA